MDVLGIDFGGSGIKGFPINAETGEALAERYRIATPNPATPKAVAKKIAELTAHFQWKGPVGCGFPAAVKAGVVRTAANIDKEWIGKDAAALFSEATGCPFKVLNDADAAGLAELTFGAGKNRQGVVILITVGTGLGTVVFNDGHLLPNTEFGHVEYKGDIAERYASDAVRKRDELKWKEWAARFDEYLCYLTKLFYPDLFIIGGGISKKMDKFSEYLKVNVPVVPAELKNNAGIVGAALAAANL
ncbi:MAG TPA: ROK family protein [Candidatus Marinimicrobia bacterium]|nr:ROK family protein [Candidatus Neomarinimicrobiota bacterium]